MNWQYVNTFTGTRSPADMHILSVLSGVCWANLLPAGGFPTAQDRDLFFTNKKKILKTIQDVAAEKAEEWRKQREELLKALQTKE